MLSDSDREQAAGLRATHDTLGAAARGLAILNRLVHAPDHGAGFRRDPVTGFIYYSSEWLDDELPAVCTQRCVVCGQMIEPKARYFTDRGEPRHMLCETA